MITGPELSRLIEHDAEEGDFICPVCDYPGHVEDGGVWCEGGCSPEVLAPIVAQWAALPPICPKAYERAHARDQCLRCARRVAAVRRLDHGFGSDADDGEGWAPQSWDDVDETAPPSVLMLPDGECLLRRGWVTLLHGEFGSAKTPLAYLAVVEQVLAGNMALILDHEMTQGEAKKLLSELGLTTDQIKAGVYYRYSPDPITPSAKQRLMDEVEKYGRDLSVVIIDSLTESMAMVPGASDNDALDVAAWAKMTSWLADAFDAAVVVIDHSMLGDGPRPSGSHKKREFPQFHVWCKKGTPFSRESPESGYSTLYVQKDRSGEREIGKPVATIRTRPAGSFYLGPVEQARKGEVEMPLDMQPDDATEDYVLGRIEKAGRGGLMTSDVTGSGAVGQYRRQALATLEAAGRVVSLPAGRAGRGKRYWTPENCPEE
ncbi:MAG: AAA family ATPase [Actinobacteria bacterium]|nr:AAA family ATPase [Actinomycetota bacterium]